MPPIAPPKALSIDLDDTLWPIWPVIEQAEHALHAFLCERCPNTARLFPIAEMRVLRDRIADENPHLAHDFTVQRRMSLAHAMQAAGDDEVHVDDAFRAFYDARNRITFYPDALAALDRLAARWPIAALTNGNADLASIGIADRFATCVAAREAGHAKPDAPIFHATCDRLGVAPADVLHIGDDPLLDVAGAARVGMRTCWINRRGETWPSELPPPDLEFTTLDALADWLDQSVPHDAPRHAPPPPRESA